MKCISSIMHGHITVVGTGMERRDTGSRHITGTMLGMDRIVTDAAHRMLYRITIGGWKMIDHGAIVACPIRIFRHNLLRG